VNPGGDQRLQKIPKKRRKILKKKKLWCIQGETCGCRKFFKKKFSGVSRGRPKAAGNT
jgi:hypothetical protein